MKEKAVLLLFALTILSCSSRQTLTPLDVNAEYEQALSFFDNKKYDAAIQAFERILFYHPTSEYVDDAQYWLARTYYEEKNFEQAIAEFDYLIRNFSTSKYIEEGYLFRAKSYLHKAPAYYKDPTEIENAINLFDQFLTRFPNSTHTDDIKKHILMARNRLAIKELENGKLYIKLGEKDAALLYFNYILDTYPETDVSSEARFLAATIHEEKGELLEALELLKELLEDEEWKTKTQKKIDTIERELSTSK
jgi:outer membrane protein assembly factor BamD